METSRSNLEEDIGSSTFRGIVETYGDFLFGTQFPMEQTQNQCTGIPGSSLSPVNCTLPFQERQHFMNNQFNPFSQPPNIAEIQQPGMLPIQENPSMQPIAMNMMQQMSSNCQAVNMVDQQNFPLASRANVPISDVQNISYTDMLLGVEMSAEPLFYRNLQQVPLGQENKLFMITGRYLDDNKAVSEEEHLNQQLNHNSMDHSDLIDLENTETWQFDGSASERENNNQDYVNVVHMGSSNAGQFDGNSSEKADNNENDADLSDEFLEEPVADYDIFGDDNEETCNEINDVEDPNCAEHLSQEDILSFLENDSNTAAKSCSQEVRSRHVPHIDQLFDSDEKAYEFYNHYASICGFSVKKASNYHGKTIPGAAHTRATFSCNRSGKIVDPDVLEDRRKKKQERKIQRTGIVPVENTKRRRRNTIEITDCKAKMVVSFRNGKWVVITLDLEHNHELSPPDETNCLLSHKHITNEEKLFIRTFNSVKLPTRKIMGILRYLRGGVVPYTKKDVSNVRTAIRKECSHNDMIQVLHYFRKRQADDPRFYYAFKTEGKKVLSIFWTDGNSRNMYDLYGDCISFDTTYKTNKYNLPFAPFVGVTGHGNNCLFACAIMQNEQIETFKWVFETFLDCMGGKFPKTIITDQCVSMRTAIPAVFPGVVHRNCFFHVCKKAEEKCGRSFATKVNFHAYFSDILRNSLTTDEFEMLWQNMIHQYDVGHLKYLKAMWNHRHKFVPVYFKNAFFPFIHSTARSEGTNSVFKDNVGSTVNVISFLGEYQNICQSIQDKEREQDSVTRITKPNYWLKTEIEFQAGRIYNRQIFYKFQKQLLFASKLHVDEVLRHQRYEVYKSRLLAEKDFRPRRYIVLVDLDNKKYSCICCKFQKDGIVCGHILRVLVHLNIAELPEKYFIERWKPKERKTIRDRKYNVPMELTEKDHHLRYTLLSRRLIDIASDGCRSNAKYLVVVEDSIKLEAKLDALTIAEDLEEQQKKQGSKEAQAEPNIVNDGYCDDLINPDVAKSKGRPTVRGRQKTLVESLRTKHKITCSHCGSNKHNIATCEFKHIGKADLQKKTPAKKSSVPPSTKKKRCLGKQDSRGEHNKSDGGQVAMEL